MSSKWETYFDGCPHIFVYRVR